MSAIPAVFPAAPPSCVSRRPKRAAASKAEDVFKSLMVTGDREGRASSAEEPESDTSKTGRNVGKGTSDGDPVGWLRQQSQGKRGVGGVVFEVDVLVAGRDSKGEHDSGFEGVSNATGNRKKVATTMGRAKRSRGAIGKHEQWKADRPVKSSTHRRDKQKNIERPKAQGGAAASVGSVSRLLESFAEFTVSGKVVGEAPDASCALKISASKSKKLTKNHQQQQQQPQRQDVMPPKTSMALVWSALDTVLADLPPTEILTIDSLVGNGEARRRAAAGAAGGRDCPHVSTHSGASSRRTNRDEGVSLDGQNRSAGASFISRNQQQRRLANNSVPDSPAAAAAAHAASLRNSFLAGSGSGSGSVSGSEQRTESSFAIPTETPMPRQGPDVAPGLEDDECAKARRLPPAALVAQELLECEGLLRDAEAAANASLQKLTGEVESFRYNPASTEAREWRAWADETLREFAPLEERMCFDRAARRDKLADEKRRRDLQELEEKLAVCYVCDNGDYSDEDQIVFCERCCVAVHASCYNIVGVDEIGTWYCDFCEDHISKARRRLEDLERVLADANVNVAIPPPPSKPRPKRIRGGSTTPKEDSVKAGETMMASDAAMDVEDQTDSNIPTANPIRRPPPLDTTLVTSWPKTDAEKANVFSDAERSTRSSSRAQSSSSSSSSSRNTQPIAPARVDDKSSFDARKDRPTSLRHAPNATVSSHEEIWCPTMGEDPQRGQDAPAARNRHAAAVITFQGEHNASGDDVRVPQDADTPLRSSLAKKAAMGAGEGHTNIGSNSANMTLGPAADAVTAAAWGMEARTAVEFGATGNGETNGELEREARLLVSVADLKFSQRHHGIERQYSGTREVENDAEPTVARTASMNLGDKMNVEKCGDKSGDGEKNGGDLMLAEMEEAIVARIKQQPQQVLQRQKEAENGGEGDDLRCAGNRDWDDPAESAPSLQSSVSEVSFGKASPSGRRSVDRRSNDAVKGKANGTVTAAARGGAEDEAAFLSGAVRKGEEWAEGTGGAPVACEQQSFDDEDAAKALTAGRLQLEEDIADARVALEEAVELVGVEFPSQQKGPRDDDARCQLCPAIGGAFLRASKGKKHGRGMGWCHCLCALSLQLPIENRVVQTKGYGPAEKGHTTPPCSVCRRAGRGGLIPCAEKGCKARFHPVCGKESGGSAERGPHIPSKDWTARCKRHALVPAVALAEAATTVQTPDKKKGAAQGSKRTSSDVWKGAPKARVTPARRGSRGGVRSRMPQSRVPSARIPNIVVVDDEISRLREEAREVIRVEHPACAEGKCHRCRKSRRWTIGCHKCPQRFCATCIASQRESPLAVAEMVKAAAKDLAEGLLHPKPSFTCYLCRGMCLCSTCRAKGGLAGRPVVKPVPKPKVVLAVTAATAAASTEAGKTDSPTPTTTTTSSSPPPVPTKTAPAKSATANTTRLPKAEKRGSPKLVPSKRRSSPEPQLVAAAAAAPDPRAAAIVDSQRQGRKRQRSGNKPPIPSDRPYAPSTAQSDGSPTFSFNPAMPHPPSGTSPLASAPVRAPHHSGGQSASGGGGGGKRNENGWNTHNHYNSNGRLSSHHHPPPSTCNGVHSHDVGRVAAAPTATVNGFDHARDGDHAAAAAVAETLKGVNGAKVEPPTELSRMQAIQGPSTGTHGGMGLGRGGGSVLVGPSNTSTITTLRGWKSCAPSGQSPASGATVAMTPDGAMNQRGQVHGQIHGQTRGQWQEVPTFSNTPSYGSIHPPDAATPVSEAITAAIHRAQAARARATDAAHAARRAADDTAKAKAFSNRHNKAAMQEVENATALKDKLLLANELVSGYAGLRANAQMAVHSADADEKSAVMRLRAAQVEAKFATEAAAVANANVATENGRPGVASGHNNSSNINSNGSPAVNGGTRQGCASSSPPAGARTTASSNANVSGGDASSWSSTTDQSTFWSPGWWSMDHSSNPSHTQSASVGTRESVHNHQSQPSLPRNAPAAGASQNSALTLQSGTLPNATALNAAVTRTSTPNTFNAALITPPPVPSEAVVQRAAEASALAAAAQEKVTARRQMAIAATSAARDQEANLVEIQKRLSDAEKSRTKLVKYTQKSSDDASKASQAAMHFEAVARGKQAEAVRAAEVAQRLEWEARDAEWQVHRAVDEERNKRSNAFYCTDARMGVGSGVRTGLGDSSAATACQHKRKADTSGLSTNNDNSPSRQKTC